MRKHPDTILVIGLAALLAVPAGVTDAAPPERERWDIVDSYVDEELCDGLSLQVDLDLHGSLVIVRHGKAALQYFVEKYRNTVSFTNLATGKTYRGEFAGINKDLEVVDNGDGTLTITALGTGTGRWYAGGKLVLTDNGQVRWQVLIDHAGTPNDYTDDVFLADLGIVKGSTGTNDTDGRDFCDDVELFTR